MIYSGMENVWDPNALSGPSIFEVETEVKLKKKKNPVSLLINDSKVTMYSNLISSKQISISIIQTVS